MDTNAAQAAALLDALDVKKQRNTWCAVNMNYLAHNILGSLVQPGLERCSLTVV